MSVDIRSLILSRHTTEVELEDREFGDEDRSKCCVRTTCFGGLGGSDLSRESMLKGSGISGQVKRGDTVWCAEEETPQFDLDVNNDFCC